MNTDEKTILTAIIQVKLMEKFLNDPKRQGMTEQEQMDRLAAIEGIGK